MPEQRTERKLDRPFEVRRKAQLLAELLGFEIRAAYV